MASAVAPAADVHSDADRGRVTGRVLDVDAHDGVLAAHTLRAEADRVDAVLEELLHLGCALVLVMGTDGTHQSLLGKEGCGLNGSRDAYADQERRACIEAVGGHAVQDELGDAFVAFAGHQDGRVAGKRASAACHVGVDLAAVPVGNDVPPYGRCAFADVLAGVVLVKSLDGVVAQGRRESRLHDRVFEESFQLVNERESRAALQPELENAGVLAGRPVELDRELLVAEHRLINDLCEGAVLFGSELLKFRDDVVRKLLACVAYKTCDDIGHSLDLCFCCHVLLSFRSVDLVYGFFAKIVSVLRF